jgi:hypothetical protein
MADAVTRQDLAELKREIVGAVQTSQTYILDQVQQMVRDAQTEILKAYLPSQEGHNIRFRTMDATDRGLAERIEVLERRLQEIEKKLLMNPPAA